MTGGLSDLDREQLSKTEARTAVLLKTPERVERICADIAKHFQDKVEPNGFGAQVVTYDRERGVLYKQELDRVLPPETSDIVTTVHGGEDEYATYRRDREAEERLLDRFRDPNDPLRVLIVTSKLLTGFDAPTLQTTTGYEGLIAAQQWLPDNATRDRFAADYSYLARLWEALSPDPSLESYEADYRWLSQVYESVKPSTGTGRLLWHTLGAKTIDLIHRHVHVDTVRDDLETLVVDAEVLDAVLGTPDPDKKSKEIEIKVANRLRKHLHDPRFPALGERLEELRQKHEQGLLVSIEFLKSLLDLARDVVHAERTVEPATSEERGKTALTELFEEARQRQYAHHGGASRQRHRRDRSARPLRGLADDPRRRAGSEEGA